ncbi:Rv1535 family protein [Mycobacterium kansasii]|uniref:Uncharacterized protein n=2 Tax=Mycobacterium kansasii TaxID=1768 RepID=A0A653EWT1_MYCKA|nr:Rv1535 family protein [Mycobacterium kansasii]AGZ53641.1 hypothetical protein MKAN_27570 [Mycobacterium kansasii ATCC 12478]ARG54774.1 hypothetical protein B1T43_01600 [Mycobacterium kansasii]ARG60226.1 hypothetical protein B1T45_01605 [Mycobacterium kansasii]ARG67961.1 hypothetical protein B1T47_01700 [Mycobacterium kansasii]ARG77525.1 hypothetical protein B1T51_27120 [Mycobacterium kansasii]
MTAVLYDEVVTATPAPRLRVVREGAPIETSAPAKVQVARRTANPPFGVGGDPLVDGAARLLTIPIRHVYAALWRIGVLEVRV